ncbi:MAG: portal protein [Pseudomonadota bacterium]
MPDHDTLAEAREAFELCAEAEAENRAAALDDLRFARLGEQWPDEVRRRRERESRPCLTINKLPAFVRQVVNDARANKPAIKVWPVDDAADPATAAVMNGLIRNIEQVSDADVAYDTAVEFAVTMGFGYFRIGIEYAFDDSFDKELRIQRVANPFSVFGDPHSTAADSSDWNMAFVTELMPKPLFEKRWKGARPVDWEDLGYTRLQPPWAEEDRVLVAEWWSRAEIDRPILLLSSGEVVDRAAYEKGRDLFDLLGVAVKAERTTKSHKITQRLMTGAEILETNQWAGRYIPIVPVYGDEINLEGKRLFKSLIRDAKDAQRMFNYWRTTTTELVALAPKAPFIGPKDAFSAAPEKWDTANTESWAYIEYEGPVPPQRQPFTGVPAGALQEALNASDDMKAIIGMYDASLGARSNETSGRAILARQREGDVSTFHFIDNLSRAIRHAGRVLIDLIPLVYTPGRMVRVLGPDGRTAANVRLGLQRPDDGYRVSEGASAPAMAQPQAPMADTRSLASGLGFDPSGVYDLSAGKYDLVVEAGPSYSTKREEAASQMIELLRAFPQAAPVIGDLLAKNLDWPGAEEIADRLKTLLPPSLQGPDDPRVPQLEAALRQLQAKLQRLEADKSIEAAKLQVEAFEARTSRLKAEAELRRAAAAATPTSPSFG